MKNNLNEMKFTKERKNYKIYEKSLKFNEIYGKIAEDNNCYFVDNNGLETGSDKVHLTKESHALLAEKLKAEISKIYQ